MPLLLLFMGGAALWWLLTPKGGSTSGTYPSSTYPQLPAATSPALSYAASYMPNPNAPIPSGLPTGWYWEDQQNSSVIMIGDGIKAIAMSPDDIPSTVYGTAIDTANDITFQITSATNPATGLANGQQMVLPVSYVTSASSYV